MAVKENCYWFEEDHDMGARIPFCKIKEDFQPLEPSDCESCGYYHSKYQRTRADNIRAMSDEKLASEIYVLIEEAFCAGIDQRRDRMTFPTENSFLDWMREPAEDTTP